MLDWLILCWDISFWLFYLLEYVIYWEDRRVVWYSNFVEWWFFYFFMEIIGDFRKEVREKYIIDREWF